jgi:hypothetical protein
MSENLQPLLNKLEKARFTGTLDLHFEAGQVASARLTHFLPFAEIQDRELVTLEPEKKVKGG